ncbi:MAG: radical SAM protein [Deltaproteobacteria bacterium]|nr:radical SAM protein [Deltaproteobacteria bacterium]
MIKRRIKDMQFEVCSPCQLDCKFCATGEMRVHDSHYQLSLEQLDRFLYHTEQSGYFIEKIWMHGPGEPLLWRHLNEGLRRLRASAAIGKIEIITNGTYLKRIEETAWDCIDIIDVNIYEDRTKIPLLERLQAFFGAEKIRPRAAETFKRVRDENFQPATIPGKCRCSGPMLYGDKVFLFCGPPVFGAALRATKDLLADRSLWVEVGPNYLEGYDEKIAGTLDLCRFCWANENMDEVLEPHTSIGGGWQPQNRVRAE